MACLVSRLAPSASDERVGNILISVHSDNRDETKRAKEIFERDGADEVSSSSEEKVHPDER